MSDRGIVAALADSICRGDKPTRIVLSIDANIDEATVPINVQLEPSDLQDMEIIKKKIEESKNNYRLWTSQLAQAAQLLQQHSPFNITYPYGTQSQFPYSSTSTGYAPYSSTSTGYNAYNDGGDLLAMQQLQQSYNQSQSYNQYMAQQMSFMNQYMDQYINMVPLITNAITQRQSCTAKDLMNKVKSVLKGRSQHQEESDD